MMADEREAALDAITQLGQETGGYDTDDGALRAALARAEQAEAAVLALREVARPNHAGHWDRTGGSGSGCPECQRAHTALSDTAAAAQEVRKRVEREAVRAFVEWLKERPPTSGNSRETRPVLGYEDSMDRMLSHYLDTLEAGNG